MIEKIRAQLSNPFF